MATMDDPLRVHAEALADLDRQVRDARAVQVAWESDAQLRALEGRLRILRRHAPRQIPTAPVGYVVCDRCDQGPPPARHVRWEDCPDWRDAAGQETPG